MAPGEGRRLVLDSLRGDGRYADDTKLRGKLHAAFVRSPHAHAHILSVKT